MSELPFPYGATGNILGSTDQLAPEWIHPEVYFDSIKSSNESQPERRLMLALLQDAITLYQRVLVKKAKQKWIPARDQGLMEECEAWFKSDARDALYSFENICNVTGIDPDYLRQGIKRLRRVIVQSRGLNKVPRFRRGHDRGVGRHTIGIRRTYT